MTDITKPVTTQGNIVSFPQKELEVQGTQELIFTCSCGSLSYNVYNTGIRCNQCNVNIDMCETHNLKIRVPKEPENPEYTGGMTDVKEYGHTEDALNHMLALRQTQKAIKKFEDDKELSMLIGYSKHGGGAVWLNEMDADTKKFLLDSLTMIVLRLEQLEPTEIPNGTE